MSSQRLDSLARVVSQTPLGVYGGIVLPHPATYVCWGDEGHVAGQAGSSDGSWDTAQVVEIDEASGAMTTLDSGSNQVRAGGGIVAWQIGGGVRVRWRRGVAAVDYLTGGNAYVMDVEGGRVLYADGEKQVLTLRNEAGVLATIRLVGGGLTSDDWDGPGANLVGDYIFARTDTFRLYSATTGAELPMVRIAPQEGKVPVNYAVPVLLADGRLKIVERTDRLTIRDHDSRFGSQLVAPGSDFFGINAREIDNRIALTYWRGVNYSGWSGLLVFDLATLPVEDLDPPPPPVDTTTPFPKLKARVWEAFWKTETPDSNYGRVDAPTNAVVLEGRSYDPALHGHKAILSGNPEDGVPAWNGSTGLVAVPVSMEANRLNLVSIRAGRAVATAVGVPEAVNADGTSWMEHPDWIDQAEALREPGDGWELWLMDELYPKQGESRADRYARWRAVCRWHVDRYRITGRRWAVTVSCYPQARPQGPNDPAPGFPVPGVGYPIHQIAEDQRALATILASEGDGLALLMAFSDLRYGGMSWTYPDGSRPLYPFRQLWADANPAGPDPALILSQDVTAPPVEPPAPGDDEMATILNSRVILTGEIQGAYIVGRGREATKADLAFQLGRFDCQEPRNQPGPRELWPPERIFQDILAGDVPAGAPVPRYNGRLTVEQCALKTVAEIVRMLEGGA
jgi:hypothetical protein